MSMDNKFAEIFSENFSWLKLEYARLDDLKRALLKEIAASMGSCEMPSPTELLDMYVSLAESLSPSEFMRLCSAFKDRLSPSEEFSTSPPSPQSVIYLRSNVSDRAFDCFSSKFNGLGAHYGTDFKSICEDVYYDKYDACILPLESSSDGLLMSFRHLLVKYELYIVDTFTAKQNDGTVLTLALIAGSKHQGHGGTYELYFPGVDRSDIINITEIITSAGGSILRINSIRAEHGDDCDHHVCADIPADNANALLYCFGALYPSYIILGNYNYHN